MDGTNRQDQAAARLIEAMGRMAADDGEPPIAGRIMAYLLIAGEARPLGRIASDLNISKASASTNVRRLERRGIARRAGKAGGRQDLWLASPRPHVHMLGAYAARFRANAQTVAEIARDFPAAPNSPRDRVRDMAEFYRASADFFEEWQQRIAGATCKDVQDE